MLKEARVRIEPGQTKSSLRVTDIPIDLIRPDPKQPRRTFDEESLAELAASIKRHGLLQPITVRRDPRKKGAYVVVAGERRYRALQRNGAKHAPAVITVGDADEIALIENLQREDLSPIEEAEALDRLRKKHGYTHEELGRAVGKARSTITNLLKIGQLAPKIRREAAAYQANRSVLIELSKVKEAKAQLKLWKAYKQNGFTVKKARHVKRGVSEVDAQDASLARTAKRLLQQLEGFTRDGHKLSASTYDEMLGVYKQLVVLMEQQGEG